MLCDDFNEKIINKITAVYFAREDQKDFKSKILFEEILPPYLQMLDDLCSKGNKYLLSNELTAADFFVGGLYTNYMANPNVGFGKE